MSGAPKRLVQMRLAQETDVVLSRNRARIIAESLGFERNDQVRIATAVSEIARNAYRYATEGMVAFAIAEQMAPGGLPSQFLVVEVSDKGAGIKELDAVLAGTYTSRTGMGMGLRGARRLMDKVEIDTAETGTTVRLWQKLPRGHEVSTDDLRRISQSLAESGQKNPLEELAVQNRDLAASLEEISEQRLTLAEVNDELKETNRGVVALYDELETVHRLGRVVASKLDLDSLLEAITDATTDLSGAEFGAFYLAAKGSNKLTCLTVAGQKQPANLAGASLEIDLLHLPESSDTTRYDEAEAKKISDRLSMDSPLLSVLACSVRDTTGELMGALVFGHSAANVFTERTERILSTVAVQASVGIANAQLYRNVQSANDAKAQFLAVLSHELRTPLNPVFAILSTFEERSDLSPEMRADLHIMRRNLQLEARLIDDLLDLTRISEGKLPLKQETVDLHQIARAAVQTCQPEMDRKALRSRFALAAGRHHVPGDPTRLQQVLWNLIHNAIKFSPEGAEIALVSSNPTAGTIELRVVDQGRGIEPAALERVFMPFEQEDRNVTNRFGGLGLGLAISRGLMRAHHGTIHAESEGVQRGASFVIRLPAVDAPQLEFAPIKATVDQVTTRRRILLVDDHEDTRMVMGRILAARGFQVTEAASVEEAFAKYQANPFDMVISDLGLPDGSGHELMERMQKVRRVKGIALSGYGMEEDRKRSSEVGFSIHLTKPVEMKLLDEAIQKILAEPL